MFAVEALFKIIEMTNGSKSLLADSLRQLRPGTKICSAHINNWIYRDKKIPPTWVIPLAEVVSYKVTPNEISPDMYPHPNDGLPTELRVAYRETA